MKRWIATIVLTALTSALIWALDRPLGPLPPLGRLLEPHVGLWANAETDRPFGDTPGEGHPLDLPGLRARVTVQFDDRMVPHVFAENAYDLYYTQGYLHARFRLFQMDLLTRFAAGTLSEILGSATIGADRRARQYGFPYAAERMLAQVMADSITAEAVSAYTAGANAWIEPLTYADYPIEYKLLDARPSPWAPIRCALLSRYMAWDLTSDASDRQMSLALEQIGPEAVAELFPNYPEVMDPIIPPGTKWDFKPVPIPSAPEVNGVPLPKPTDPNTGRKGIGSNNWAVAPAKTAAGNPILANDPHLKLNLPSIWFEQQLTIPGQLQVYGVVVPGAPGIGIGFNERIAWGFTNVGADFMDFYRLTLVDSNATAYRYGSEVRPITERIETIRVKGGADVADTVRWTHYGPMPYYRPRGDRPPLAVRWLGYEPTNELRIFHTLMTARGYDDYVRAMETPFSFPQNMAFISRDKDIALWISGRHILRWPGQGKFVSDGADPRYEWQGWIPSEQNPHVKNPPRGFISSANQQSADKTYPYYLDWDQAGYERGHRINRRLEAMSAITVDSMRRLQGDNYNTHAASVLPTLLQQLDAASLPPGDKQAYEDLSRWNHYAEAGSAPQSVFYLWWRMLNEKIWSDDLREGAQWPDWDRTVLLITQQPSARWFDRRDTKEVETLQQLTRQAYAQAVDSLGRAHGPYGPKWAWGEVKNQRLEHLLPPLKAFGVPIPIGGGSRIVNAASNPEGPSWRMVVEMTPTGPQGYGIYPGGQSGNPGSPHYDDFVPTWVNVELKPLNFWTAPVEHSKAKTTLKLSPAQR